jgi:hypothetical protein
MPNRLNKIFSIFSAIKKAEKISFASDNELLLITRELFLQNLKGRSEKDTADIPRVTVAAKK